MANRCQLRFLAIGTTMHSYILPNCFDVIEPASIAVRRIASGRDPLLPMPK